MQGAGTNILTPIAAAVAEALADTTVGLAFDWHDIWNGFIFIIGLLSRIFAIGCLLDMALFIGKTTREPGTPSGKVPESGMGVPGGSVQLLSHFNIAPFVTIGFATL